MLNVSVVVPTRNAECMIEECLKSIVRAEPREIIVVDGLSTDQTREIAQRYSVQILSDEGRGVAAARSLGIQAAVCPIIALIDVDIVLPEGSLAKLLEEFERGQYAAFQAGLRSVSGIGYWGQALVYHHNSGRSKNWLGVMATLFRRETLLEHNFDPQFRSGEDIELRWRLQRANVRMGVSHAVTVIHRFDDTFASARAQWLADGHGFGRMIRKYGIQATSLLGIPLIGALRGSVLSILHGQPRWIPYYIMYLVYNYVGLMTELFAELRSKTVLGNRQTEHEQIYH